MNVFAASMIILLSSACLHCAPDVGSPVPHETYTDCEAPPQNTNWYGLKERLRDPRVVWAAEGELKAAGEEASYMWSGTRETNPNPQTVTIIQCGGPPPLKGMIGSAVVIPGGVYYIRVYVTQQDGYDLPTLLAHELGHLMGLGHHVSPDDLMYDNYRGKRDVSVWDRAEFLKINLENP
jgi:hypothetical protein